jgi:predicted ATP-grasp superfamily ATP-dependent carboligase
MIALDEELPGRPAIRDVASTPQSRGAPPAIVIGLDYMAGLQTARILWQRGVRVIGIAQDPSAPACRTRACERVVIADTTGTALIDALEELETAGEASVLIPCTDDAVLLISCHRERIEPAHTVSLPDHRTVETLLDKTAFSEYAARQGLPVPRTLPIEDRADATAAASELRFPCILKPSMRTAAWNRRGFPKGFKLLTPDDLLDAYDRAAPFADPFLAQEWIEGEDSALYVCIAYFDRDARPLVTFVAQKIRQWPPQIGSASAMVECRNDEVLNETLRLFEGVGFHGLAFLEMKRDARTGEYLITEPNVGRPGDCSGHPEAAGVELLHTAYCDAAGLELPSDREQRHVGAKWVSLRSDLKSGLAYRKQGKLGWREWLRSLRGRKAYAELSVTDPLPFLLDLLQTAPKLFTGRTHTWSPDRRSRPGPVDASPPTDT